MGITEIITQMKADVSALSLGEVAIGGLSVTLLSMAIVFIVLVLLMFMIKLMTKVMVKTEKPATTPSVAQTMEKPSTQEVIVDNSEEIAAVMAAISAISQVSENKLIIRNITSLGESNWSLQGRISQIGNRI